MDGVLFFKSPHVIHHGPQVLLLGNFLFEGGHVTSSFEGFPNTLIEDQSFGAAPVAFNSYPMIEMIVDGTNSVLVPTFNLKAMGDAIVELANNDEKRFTLMENSLTNARRFTIEKVGERWLQLFDQNAVAK